MWNWDLIAISYSFTRTRILCVYVCVCVSVNKYSLHFLIEISPNCRAKWAVWLLSIFIYCDMCLIDIINYGTCSFDLTWNMQHNFASLANALRCSEARGSVYRIITLWTYRRPTDSAGVTVYESRKYYLLHELQ